jgi:maltose phosphorylase
MQNTIFENGKKTAISPANIDTTTDNKIQFSYDVSGSRPKIIYSKLKIQVSLPNHSNTLSAAEKLIKEALALDTTSYLQDQIKCLGSLGHVRYHYCRRCKGTARYSFQYFSVKPNLFRKDSRLNIGPKGFTGEK